MPVQLASYIVPKNNGAFFLLEDKHLKGGYRICDDVAARDAIYSVSRKLGMLVYTAAENKFWQYVDIDTWFELPVGVAGPVGPTGPAGVQGITGVDGPIGPTGPTGLNGSNGPTGPTGPSGAQGPQGATGLQGPPGVMGAAGPQGAAGVGDNPSLLCQYVGSVTPSVGTMRYYPKETITINKAALWVTGSAGSNITVHILKNGTIIQVLSLPSGSTIRTVSANFVITPSDYVTYNVIAGTGLNLGIRLDY